MPHPNQEIHLKVLRHLEGHPDVTQRELARYLGVSLGKVNYCLKALIDRGWIKANNFKNSNNKAAYAYLLTPRGIEGKTQITIRFSDRRCWNTNNSSTRLRNWSGKWAIKRPSSGRI